MNDLAYVLHSRAYRESSLLLEVLTQEHGRIAVVARGAKRGKSKQAAILQPFIPLSLTWFGNSELVTLQQAEVCGLAHNLYAKRAICGLYLNELLIKLLHKWDPCTDLFKVYTQSLFRLSDPQIKAKVTLRCFEKQLLKSLGYALQLSIDIETGLPINPEQYYVFDPILGPRLASYKHMAAISGACLLALDTEIFETELVFTEARQLMRMVLNYHLDRKQIITRELL